MGHVAGYRFLQTDLAGDAPDYPRARNRLTYPVTTPMMRMANKTLIGAGMPSFSHDSGHAPNRRRIVLVRRSAELSHELLGKPALRTIMSSPLLQSGTFQAIRIEDDRMVILFIPSNVARSLPIATCLGILPIPSNKQQSSTAVRTAPGDTRRSQPCSLAAA